MAQQTFATKAAAEAFAGVDGAVQWEGGATPWRGITVDDVVPDPRPTVSKWQLVQACVDAGITEVQIDTAVLTLTAKRQRFWRYTDILDRDNPFSTGLRAALPGPPTPKAWNAIFIAAAGLDPLKV